MVRLARRFATATLILLTVLVPASWIRSHYDYDLFGWQSYRFTGEQLQHRVWSIGCVRGRLLLHVATTDLEPRQASFAWLSPQQVRAVQQIPAVFSHSSPAVQSAEWDIPAAGSILNQMGFVIARGLKRDHWSELYRPTNLNPIPYLSRSSTFCTVMLPHWLVSLTLLGLSYPAALQLAAGKFNPAAYATDSAAIAATTAAPRQTAVPSAARHPPCPVPTPPRLAPADGAVPEASIRAHP